MALLSPSQFYSDKTIHLGPQSYNKQNLKEFHLKF